MSDQETRSDSLPCACHFLSFALKIAFHNEEFKLIPFRITALVPFLKKIFVVKLFFLVPSIFDDNN